MKITDLLAKLDTLSPTYTLNIEGKDRVKTKLGGCLVLLSFLTLVAYAVSSLVAFFRPTKYEKLEIFTENAEHAAVLNLFDLKRLPMVSVIDHKGDYLRAGEIEHHLSLRFGLYNRTTQTNYSAREFAFINCSAAAAGYQEYFSAHAHEMAAELREFDSYLCLNASLLRQAELEGNYDEGVDSAAADGTAQRAYPKGYRQASVRLGPCATSSCQVNDAQLAAYTYKLAFFEARSNFSNYKNPVSFTTTLFHSDLLNPNVTRQIFAGVGLTTIKDDLGMPLGLVVKESYTTVMMEEDYKRPRISAAPSSSSTRRMLQDTSQDGTNPTDSPGDVIIIDPIPPPLPPGTVEIPIPTPPPSPIPTGSDPTNSGGWSEPEYPEPAVQQPSTGSDPTNSGGWSGSAGLSNQGVSGSNSSAGDANSSSQLGSSQQHTVDLPSQRSVSASPYVTYILESSLSQTQVIRTYKPITDILAAIGGMKVNIYLFFTLLHLILGSSLHKYYVVEKVYKIVPDQKGWLCCRKKKGVVGQQNGRGSFFVPQMTIEKAYISIVRSLDVASLSSQLNVLRFVVTALLRDYHLALVPLMAVNKFMKEQDEDVRSKAQKLQAPKASAGREGQETQNMQAPTDSQRFNSRGEPNQELRSSTRSIDTDFSDLDDHSVDCLTLSTLPINEALRKLEESLRVHRLHDSFSECAVVRLHQGHPSASIHVHEREEISLKDVFDKRTQAFFRKTHFLMPQQEGVGAQSIPAKQGTSLDEYQIVEPSARDVPKSAITNFSVKVPDSEDTGALSGRDRVVDFEGKRLKDPKLPFF